MRGIVSKSWLWRVNLLMIGTCLACDQPPAEPESGVGSHRALLVASPRVAPYRLAQTSIRPGATNVGPESPMMFEVQPTTGAVPEPDTGDLAGRASYVSKDGTVTAAMVEKIQKKPDAIIVGSDYSLAFRPTVPLNGDAWYWFTFRQDDSVSVAAPKNPDGNFSSHFFTGSAPHIVRMERSLKSPSVTLHFSEPIEVSTLQIVGTFTAGTASARCLALDGACQVSTAALHMWADFVEVTLDRAAGRDLDTAIFIVGTLQGSARLAGAGAVAAGRAVDPALAGITLRLASTDWQDCPGGGSLCWSETLAVGQ